MAACWSRRQGWWQSSERSEAVKLSLVKTRGETENTPNSAWHLSRSINSSTFWILWLFGAYGCPSVPPLSVLCLPHRLWVFHRTVYVSGCETGRPLFRRSSWINCYLAWCWSLNCCQHRFPRCVNNWVLKCHRTYWVGRTLSPLMRPSLCKCFYKLSLCQKWMKYDCISCYFSMRRHWTECANELWWRPK